MAAALQPESFPARTWKYQTPSATPLNEADGRLPFGVVSGTPTAE